MKDMDEKEKIEFIKSKLNLDESTIRSIGKGPLMAQIAAEQGMEGVLKCDADSGDTSQYTGDLEKDLRGRQRKGEGKGRLR